MINCCLKDLMRVLLCKIHCSLFCLCNCKPLSHIYKESLLKLENSPPPPHKSLKTLVSAIDDDDDDDNDVHQEVVSRSNDGIVEEEGKEEEGPSLVLKSSLRKFDSNSRESEKMKRVQWVDVMGIKELADIREYEPSEEDDMGSDRGKACDCVIL